jgi:hypothetical protein
MHVLLENYDHDDDGLMMVYPNGSTWQPLILNDESFNIATKVLLVGLIGGVVLIGDALFLLAVMPATWPAISG